MNIFLLVVTFGLAGYVWWRSGVSRRQEAQEEAERASYRRRIAEDPANLGAYELLGDSLRRAGRLDEAQAAYEDALNAGADERIHDRTRYKLGQLALDLDAQAQQAEAGSFGWRRRRPIREAYFCHVCGEANHPARRTCERCGKPLPLDSYWDALRDKETVRATLESVSILFVLAVVLHVFAALPIEVKGVLLIATIMVLGWRFLQWIEGRRRIK